MIMTGTSELTKKNLEEVLDSFKKDGAVSVEINAGSFAKTCDFSPALDIVCDVLRKKGKEIVKYPEGISGYGKNMIVRFDL